MPASSNLMVCERAVASAATSAATVLRAAHCAQMAALLERDEATRAREFDAAMAARVTSTDEVSAMGVYARALVETIESTRARLHTLAAMGDDAPRLAEQIARRHARTGQRGVRASALRARRGVARGALQE